VPPSKKEVALHLKNILELENIDFELDDIAIIINSSYSDIRQIINSAQRQVVDKKLVLDTSSIIHNNYKLKLLELLRRGNSFNDIRQLIADNFVNDYIELYKLLYDEVDTFAENQVSEVIIAIAESQYRDQFVVDKEINFMALIIQILKII
jgi:DNA polymerase III delta prime subunit